MLQNADYLNEIKVLYVANFKNVQSQVDYFNEYAYDMASGFWLNELLDSCSSLRELTLVELFFITLSKNEMKKNMPLEKLILINLDTTTGDTIMENLSTMLPSLNYLYITHLTKPTKFNLKLKMGTTAFDTLVWENTINQIVDHNYKFYLRIITALNGRKPFLVGSERSIDMCSSKEISQATKNTASLVFDIRCQSLKYFHLKVDGVFDKVYDLSNILRY
jgi:hypothetical protein